jgi:hypothetical protein
MNVASADAARADANEHIVVADLGRGHFDDGQLFVFRQ